MKVFYSPWKLYYIADWKSNMHKQPEQKSSALQNLPHGNLHYVLGSSACPHWRRRWKLGKRPHPPSGTLCEVVSLPDWGKKSLFSLDGIEVKLKAHFAIFQSLWSDMVNLNHKIAVILFAYLWVFNHSLRSPGSSFNISSFLQSEHKPTISNHWSSI